jgi:hypothetical protein
MLVNEIDAARSRSGNTHWVILADGTLKEQSKDSYTFTLSIQDTHALLDLLLRNANLILEQYAAARKPVQHAGQKSRNVCQILEQTGIK